MEKLFAWVKHKVEGGIKKRKNPRQSKKTINKNDEACSKRHIVEKTDASGMVCDFDKTSNLQDSLSIQKLEDIVDLAETNSGCSLTDFVLKYHKGLLLSNKTLTKVVRQMIDDGIFDYSSGALLISPQVNMKKNLCDFLLKYPEIKKQPNQYKKEKDNKIALNPQKEIVLSNDKKLQSASVEWASFVRDSSLTVREANIVITSFKTVKEFLSAKNTDFLSLPDCGPTTARKFCKFKLICENSLNELVTSSHGGEAVLSDPRMVPSNHVKVTQECSPESTLIDRYSLFKKKHGRIPTTNELGIKPSCELRKVINGYGGYKQYIFVREELKHEDLVDEFRGLYEKHSEMSPYKILENYGKYPAWLYVRSFGNLKELLKTVQVANEPVVQNSPTSKYTSHNKSVEGSKPIYVEVDSTDDRDPLNESWQDTVLSFNLSIRAMRALVDNFSSLEEFVNTSNQDIDKMKRCGGVTKSEIINFKNLNYRPVQHKTPTRNGREIIIDEDMVEGDTEPIIFKKKKRRKIILD
ncbi:hypothetical protein [Desulforhopalus sp. 52FAK]